MFKFIVAVVFLINIFVYAQTGNPDSILTHSISDVVVTADKFPNKILNSTSSISRISLYEIQNFPVKDFYELFSLIPGVAIADKSGNGLDPVVSLRGFYGGGEAEYASVFVDGIQINDLETGLINWNFLNVENIESVEIVRGGSSALYGDAAIGGVINVTSKKQNRSLFAKAGSFNSYGAGINFAGNLKTNLFNFYLFGDKSNGFRKNSEQTLLSFGGNYFIELNSNSYLKFGTNNQINDLKKPGAVPGNFTETSRSGSFPIFREDKVKENRFNLFSEYMIKFSENQNLRLQAGIKNKNSDAVNTFTNQIPIMDPETFQPVGVYDTSLFGDTKKRKLNVNEVKLSANHFSNLNMLKTRITIGSDANFGFYNSEYFNVFNGFEEDYQNSFLANNEKINEAKGNRQDYAIFANSEINLLKNLKLNFGLRFDHINDNYNSSIPDSSIKISNSALSPKIGLNLLLTESENYSGSIYTNFNRAFKSPTVDQLINLNRLDFGIFIPVSENEFMFMPFQAEPFANSNLKPQKSSTIEFGSYNSLKILRSLFAELFLAFYSSKVVDEIDFDIASFRYENIEKTRHNGVESRVSLRYKNKVAAFVNYTINKVKFLSGNYENNFVKGVPENVLSAGINISNIYGFYSGIIFNSYSGTFLDDENNKKLNDRAVTDFRLGYKAGKFDIYSDIKNIFDKKYNSTGYLLNGTKYFYPAAGRTISGGIRFEF